MIDKPTPLTKTLRSFEYGRDPLEILIEKERHEQPCKGCKHDNGQMVFGKRVHDCAKGRQRRNSKCYEDAIGPTCQGGK